MFNRHKHKLIAGSREAGSGNQPRETMILKPAQLAPDLVIKQYWGSSNCNQLAEKIPLQQRGRSHRPHHLLHTLSSEHSSPEPSSVDDDVRYPQNRNTTFSPKTTSLHKNYPVFPQADRVLFMENPISPGVPVLYRTVEERSINPDRLNLDRRRLSVCPLLEGEDQLKLLNYQHNLIKQIQHLSYLNKLIFLDLYDNHIENIDGLAGLHSLKVLMLGKNRIKKIENLECLPKLDVLDLHNNQISEISNLNHLSELRVLNLAGNLLKYVDNLHGMDSLMELNFRRNRIQSVSSLDCLPSLQSLYLSFNDICSFSALSCLSESSSLSEVTLDGNPIAIEHSYRQNVLHIMQQLQMLDMRRVSEDERRVAVVAARKEEEKKRELQRKAVKKEKRRIAINNAKRQWDIIQGSLMCDSAVKLGRIPDSLYTQHVTPHNRRHFDLGIAHNKDISTFDDVFSITGKLEKSMKRPGSSRSVPTDASGVAADMLHTMSSSANAPCSAATDMSSTPYLSDEPQEGEISGNDPLALRDHLKSDKHTFIFGSGSNLDSSDACDLNYHADLDDNSLSMYGIDSLKELDRICGAQATGSVNTVLFDFIEFDEIVKHLPKLRARFPNILCLVLNSCNIHCLSQLNGLASLLRLDHVVIDEVNPVTKFSVWRYYLLFRLAHFSLKTINNKEVTASDIVQAEHLFGPFSHLMTTYLTSAQLITLVSESKKKQILATLEDRNSKKATDKFYDKSQEELAGRSVLVYPATSRHQKSKCKRLAKQYVSQIVTKVLRAEKKRNEVTRIWPELFDELLLNVLSDMSDINTYVNSWFDKLDKS
ncbi:leucine-rich repeat-containing protein 49-like isoform X4 [Argonauta hians]